jgi:hypothetical protein
MYINLLSQNVEGKLSFGKPKRTSLWEGSHREMDVRMLAESDSWEVSIGGRL